MTIVEVACIALASVVSAVIIAAHVVVARSDCRTNRELLRVQRVDITYTSKRRIEDMPEGWVVE